MVNFIAFEKKKQIREEPGVECVIMQNIEKLRANPATCPQTKKLNNGTFGKNKTPQELAAPLAPRIDVRQRNPHGKL